MIASPTSKDRFTALDTLALVRELRLLERARVDKAFDLPGGGWSIVLRVPGEGRRELAMVPGRYGALLVDPPPRSEELSPFAKELRRLLTGAALRSVAEPAGERFLELAFGRMEDPTELLVAFEIFGSGNLLVVRDGKIAAVASPRQWAHRSTRVRAEYVRPPSRADPWSLGRAEIESLLARSRTDLASTLGARLALGGPIAEELVARGGFDPEQPAAREPGPTAERLHRELARLQGDVGEQPKGFLYERDGVAVDATPYASERWRAAAGVSEKVLGSFSEAAYRYFSTLTAPTVSPEDMEAVRRRAEWERLADQQRRAVDGLTAESDRLRRQAEAILSHYAEAEEALRASAKDEGPDRPLEVELGGVLVPLRRAGSPRESAQILFEEAKRVQAKLTGARAALQATAEKLVVPTVPERPSGGRVGPGPPRRQRTHWFERYRWFLSSEGAVVVAGRDAASNDLVVKRHLKEGDIYVHADLHGAASVVVKHPEPGAPPLTETTYREAGQWAVSYSKAWRAGLASASAFWVAHDQVSKAGESGEFVARGGWMIHGTKHFMHDLPTELGLGTVDYAGETLWMMAPLDAVRRRGALRVVLTPGPERERSLREAELARELGIPRTLLQALLPGGGLTVRRT